MYHQKNWSNGKSMLLILLIACSLFLAVSAGSASAASVSLAWDAASGVSGYKVHYGTASGSYTASVNVGNKTAYTGSGLTDGTKYYFAVTAYDSSGIESSPSNEVVSGGTSSSCTYTISPASASFTTSGGTGSIAVSAASGCSWSVSTGVSWATVSSGASGSGSSTVSYKVAANTGAARTASFTVAGKTFTISQSGASSGTTGYTVKVSYAGTGSGTVTANPAGPYSSGTYITLTAVPNSSSVFAGWSGLCSGSTSTTCSGTVNSNLAATATFNAKTSTSNSNYTVTSSAGAGGRISPTGSFTVASGYSGSFTITPNSGYVIGDVLVDGRSVGAVSSYTFTNVTANHTISSSFKSASSSSSGYTLTIRKAGTGSGTVTASPAGPTYPSGTYITMTATPASNSVFAGWSGVCAGSTSATCSGYMRSNVTATATFNAR